MPEAKKGSTTTLPVEKSAVVNLDAEQETSESIVKVELFQLDGTIYYMVEPDATIMLKFMREIRKSGQIGAVGLMLEELIGEDAYIALMNHKGLTGEQLQKIMDIVEKFSMGRMEAMLGNF